MIIKREMFNGKQAEITLIAENSDDVWDIDNIHEKYKPNECRNVNVREYHQRNTYCDG